MIRYDVLVEFDVELRSISHHTLAALTLRLAGLLGTGEQGKRLVYTFED